jgi:predicted DNA-binding protein (MmcQ/YjbR family)
MNIETVRDYCISKPFVTEEFPFNETTLVFKVKDKMFALTSLEGDFSMNLKCDPENAIALREEYSAVQPGFHMNKKHWNTVAIDGTISQNLILQWVDESYGLVVATLPKKTQKEVLDIIS